MSRAQINMLEGSLVGPIFQFAIPVAMIGILQQMFNTADIMVLGRFVGTEALAAVGNNAPVIGVLVNLFLGISLGANVLIARKLGGGRLKEASEAIHTTVLMAGLTGLFILVVGEIFAGPLMGWMGVPLEVREASELYLRVYLLGMPGMTLYDFLSAIYRSHGNVRTPLLSLVTASIVNIAGNLLAVFLGFGLAGVVTVTAIANYISSGLLLRLLRYEHGVLHFYPGAIRVRMEDIKEILRVGVPAGIQGMVFNFSNLVIQSAINSLGTEAMAASAAGFIIEANTYCFVNGFSQATTTFVGQNYGARNLRRCFRITKVAFGVEAAFLLVVTVPVLFFSPELIRLFNGDPNVVTLGTKRLFYVAGTFYLNGIIDIISGSLRGYGYSLPPAVVVLVGICGVRITWLYTVFAAHRDFLVLMAAYPASWLVTAIVLTFVYQSCRKHIVRGLLSER